MKTWICAFALSTAGFALPLQAIAEQPHAQVKQFSTVKQAQRHCSRDEIVWLNTVSGIYYANHENWYGKTQKGAYVCKKEALAARMRPAQRGR